MTTDVGLGTPRVVTLSANSRAGHTDRALPALIGAASRVLARLSL